MMRRTLGKWIRYAVVCSLALAACACSGGSGPAGFEQSATPADRAPGFVNRVWQVHESDGVAPGTLYVFLSDGTLVITSARSTPALGSWTYTGGALTMVEESIAYRVDILALSGDEFTIRSNNPGGAVQIALAPAEVPPRAER